MVNDALSDKYKFRPFYRTIRKKARIPSLAFTAGVLEGEVCVRKINTQNMNYASFCTTACRTIFFAYNLIIEQRNLRGCKLALGVNLGLNSDQVRFKSFNNTLPRGQSIYRKVREPQGTFFIEHARTMSYILGFVIMYNICVNTFVFM